MPAKTTVTFGFSLGHDAFQVLDSIQGLQSSQSLNSQGRCYVAELFDFSAVLKSHTASAARLVLLVEFSKTSGFV